MSTSVDEITIHPDMCHECFSTLEKSLGKDYKYRKTTVIPQLPCPLFVTWSTGPSKRLRGCIGTFEANKPLPKTLQEYAIVSAQNDSRFDPISDRELNDLNVSVSLLTNFEKAKDYLDWEVGVHGIRIKFPDPINGYDRSATYLPEVASEHNWDKLQAIDSLIRKSGFNGNITPEVRESIELTRYRSQKMTRSYKEYLEFKE